MDFLKKRLTSSFLICCISLIVAGVSLYADVAGDMAIWFSPSGAIMVVAGVILAARRLIRLGYKAFVEDGKTIDGGSFDPTPEIEAKRQFELDMSAYRLSIFWGCLAL